jgi:two-component system sensor histidine kinase BaeS
MTITAEQGGVSLIVRDTGIGIEPAALPYVFDRFWRADEVRSRAEGGVGLGLALAAQIVQRHQGTIVVDSCIGKGNAFKVNLRKINVM